MNELKRVERELEPAQGSPVGDCRGGRETRVCGTSAVNGGPYRAETSCDERLGEY